MTYRDSCGTLRGAIDHQAAGEPVCGWCARGEAIAALEPEGLPRAPGRFLAPVSPAQAALNRAILAAELDAYERDHPNGFEDRHAPLRLIAGTESAA